MLDVKLKTLLINELLQRFPEPVYRLVITKNNRADSNNIFRVVIVNNNDKKSIDVEDSILTDLETKFQNSWSFSKHKLYDGTLHTNVFYILVFIENFDFFENMLINDPNDFFQFD